MVHHGVPVAEEETPDAYTGDPKGRETPFVVKLFAQGLARWSLRLVRGPLPVAWYCATKPANASIARRPLAISCTHRNHISDLWQMYWLDSCPSCRDAVLFMRLQLVLHEEKETRWMALPDHVWNMHGLDDMIQDSHHEKTNKVLSRMIDTCL